MRKIADDFCRMDPSSQICIFSGLRGSGKTVAVTALADYFIQKDNWTVLLLNSEMDLFDQILVELYDEKKLCGFLLDSSEMIPNGETEESIVIDRILRTLTEKNQSVLLCIDDVAASANLRTFIMEFQIWLQKNYRIFLLMTGTYENIRTLRNVRSMTFLYSAPTVQLDPLDMSSMCSEYERLLHIEKDQASSMARLTNGYSYAYQILGYLAFKYKGQTEKIIHEFDRYMARQVYEKLWSELSENEKTILETLVSEKTDSVTQIRTRLAMDPESFGVYRSRLIDKEMIRPAGYGKIVLTLPRFSDFIENQVLFPDES